MLWRECLKSFSNQLFFFFVFFLRTAMFCQFFVQRLILIPTFKVQSACISNIYIKWIISLVYANFFNIYWPFKWKKIIPSINALSLILCNLLQILFALNVSLLVYWLYSGPCVQSFVGETFFYNRSVHSSGMWMLIFK